MSALKAIQDNCGLAVYNLGTGKGYSVLELVEAFERVNGIKIPYVIDGRRAGDVPVVYSDPSKAERELGWRAEYGTGRKGIRMGLNNSLLKMKRDKAPRAGGALFRFVYIISFFGCSRGVGCLVSLFAFCCQV